MSTHRIFVTSVRNDDVEKSVMPFSTTTVTASWWKLNNGITVLIHYYTNVSSQSSDYKVVSVSPAYGHYDLPYAEVKASLEHVMDAIQAWAKSRKDQYEWRLEYRL